MTTPASTPFPTTGMTRNPPGWRRRLNHAADRLSALPMDLVLAPAARLAMAAVFWLSGRTKVEGWLTVSDNAVTLFAQEYKLLRREVTAGSELSLKLERAKLPDDVAGSQVVKIKCKTKDELRILVDGNDTGLACPTEALLLSPGRHTFSFLQPTTEELQDKQQKVKGGKGATKLKVKF